jgi:DUF1009 family protein
VICGGGALPFAVADAVGKRGRRVVLFAIRGWADPQRVAAYPHHWASFGQFGWFCRVAQREGCRDVVLIGSVVRPAIWKIRPDFKTLRLLPRIVGLLRGGDNRSLKGVAAIFEEHGFRLVGAHEIAPDILMPEGPLGRERPTAGDQADIATALALLGRPVLSTSARPWWSPTPVCLQSRPRKAPIACLRGSPNFAKAAELRTRAAAYW